MQENLWDDRVILAFLVLCFTVLWAMREIWLAEQAYQKFGEYQDDLNEHEKRISE